MNLKDLDDAELIARLESLVRQEREDTASVIEHLSELDDRDEVKRRGYSSLHDYCVRGLGYSEPSAYHRIRVARAIKKKPELLGLIRGGELHLEAVVLLHPHLDSEAADRLVQQARGKTKREVEELVAPLSPEPEIRDEIKPISVPPPAPVEEGMPLFEPSKPLAAAEASPAENREFSKVTFMAGPDFLNLLGRVKGLLWHKYPDGSLEDVLAEALRVLLATKDPGGRSVGASTTESDGRWIPKWIKSEVWRRDKGRCAYVGAGGQCESRSGLEFDHIRPWAHGGSSNDPANIRLLCRAHNQLAARDAGLVRPT